MGTTDLGIIYPDSSGSGETWEHFSTLATTIDSAIGSGGTFQSWTPTWSDGPSNFGAGGTNEGYYVQVGDLVFAAFRWELGTAPVISGTEWEVVLPVPAHIWGSVSGATIGRWVLNDFSAVRLFAGTIAIHASSHLSADFWGAPATGSTAVGNDRLEQAVPITMAAGDILSGYMKYRAA